MLLASLYETIVQAMQAMLHINELLRQVKHVILKGLYAKKQKTHPHKHRHHYQFHFLAHQEGSCLTK